MKFLSVSRLKQLPISEQPIEIVERKGLGHPDTITDLIVNQISIELSKEYLKKVGVILHHNIDKALLVAGETEVKFKGGIVKHPMLLVIGDRATYKAGDIDIPVDEIALRTAKNWFKKNLRFVDPYEHVKYQIELKEGSAALKDIFRRSKEILGANDTSACVGYAPYSKLEKLLIRLEKWLNSKKFKKEHPESGEDIKIMGIRKGNSLDLTIAMAFVDRFIENEKDYFRKKEEIYDKIVEWLKENECCDKINVSLNVLDRRGRGTNGIYLTVLGTSADGADCGQVGRGNRANGVISLNRPSSSEAAAGKNPVSHVGKIYNLLSFELAREIKKRINGIDEVYVWLVSKIGQRIDKPAIVSVEYISEKEINEKEVREEIE
ncbi:MAG: S-adenosylmethionine synthetase, partial [Candidatus Aenigmarchaeota archaeon ex4484_224]